MRRALEMVRLGGFEHALRRRSCPAASSSALALARALVHEPKLLLLDEPLSNLDAKLREQMRFELKRLQRTLGITTVYVTHDQAEALALSDEIAVFNSGRIVQRGTPAGHLPPPEDAGSSPTSSARPISSPASVTQEAGRRRHGQRSRPRTGPFRCPFAQAVRPGQEVLVTARPEDLMLYAAPPGEPARRRAQRAHRQGLATGCFSATSSIISWTPATRKSASAPGRSSTFHVGQSVHVGISPQKCVGLPA